MKQHDSNVLGVYVCAFSPVYYEYFSPYGQHVCFPATVIEKYQRGNLRRSNLSDLANCCRGRLSKGNLQGHTKSFPGCGGVDVGPISNLGSYNIQIERADTANGLQIYVSTKYGFLICNEQQMPIP